MMSRILTLILMSAAFGVGVPAFAQDAAAPAAPKAPAVQESEAEAAVEDAFEAAPADEAEVEAIVEAEAETDAAPAAEQPAEEQPQAAGASNDAKDFERRIELATEMHKLRPTAEQVDAAVESVSRQLPPEQASAFKINAGNMLNYRAIEKISINAMAETFTVEELEAMVDYYSKPEAKSIASKYEMYQQKVGPEIVQMIDRAIMKLRTGDTAPQ